MSVVCPICRNEIPIEDVNVSTDVALCRRCRKTFQYAELLEDNRYAEVDPEHPPKGTWFTTTLRGFEAGASTRSAAAFFLVPFMCLWSGGSLTGLYGTQIAEGKFDPARSLFGLPFLLGTIVLGAVTVMAICGSTVVRVEGEQGVVFTGIGSIGWRRRFNWQEVTAIRITEQRGNKGQISRQLTLEGKQRINFAAGLHPMRLHFLFTVLRQMHARRQP